LDGERLLGTGILSGEWVDATRWEINIAANSGAGIFVSLVGPGDANGDGIVNDQDASILAAHWQQTGMNWANGDFNDDGVVNDRDASILAAHWQEGTEGTTSVPEPGPIVLLLGGLLSLLLWRRK
jgi:hypothetical protein